MKEIGDLGEQLLSRWLELHDYQILARNWRCRWGEIDIIAREKRSETIAFVEVKTRNDRNWDRDGLLAIDSRKQHKIIQAASLFLAQHPHLAELPCRFDVGLVGYCPNEPLRPDLVLDNSPETMTAVDEGLKRLEIAQPVAIDRYRLTIKEYLQAAFD